MATLIPSYHSCSSRMTSGERRFAQLLENKLEDDYLCWYDIAIGEKTLHPDFIIFHPGRGLLVLEVKDWNLSTFLSVDKQHAQIMTDHGVKHVLNPIEQARQHMYAVTSKLERDPQLVMQEGSWAGKLIFPYGHGLVLSNINRKQFNDGQLAEVFPDHLVICKDEMTPSVEAETFQKRLWDMFPVKFKQKLSLPQIDRIRWHLFPEIRLNTQRDMFSENDQATTEIPDILRVMDIQQEQLARSMGEGHRIIHGVAGSGKTLILGYRAEHLAKVCQRPILILCYNKPLAAKLAQMIESKGLRDKVNAVNFHAWCSRQLDTYHAGKPPMHSNMTVYFEECVARVIRSVDQKIIPAAQYDAVLIDEGHDFKPEWFKLIVQMVNPETNSLLVLYDDAQSIYGSKNKLPFSFSSVGIQAKGRTNILKLNYRNTAEILAVARAFGDTLLSANDTEEDQVPTVQPMSAGRHGAKPLLIKLPSMNAEADFMANKLIEANRTGTPWNDMAVLYRRYGIGQRLAQALQRKGIPFQWQQKDTFSPKHDSIKLITMHSSKGLEFPLVCIPSVGSSISEEDDIQDEARLLYVAMTRATHDLVMSYSEPSLIAEKLNHAMDALETV